MLSTESDYICPRCESWNTVKPDRRFIAASGIVFLGVGAWTFSIPIVGLAFIIPGAAALIVTPFLHRLHYCRDCRKIWRVTGDDKPPNVIDFYDKTKR